MTKHKLGILRLVSDTLVDAKIVQEEGTGTMAQWVKVLLMILACYHRVPVQVPSALLLIQLPANAPTKADGPRTRVLSSM